MVLPSCLWGALGTRTSLHKEIPSSGGFSIPKAIQVTLARRAGSQQEGLAVLCPLGHQRERQTGWAGLDLAFSGLCEPRGENQRQSLPAKAVVLSGFCPSVLSGAASSTCASSIVFPSSQDRAEETKPWTLHGWRGVKLETRRADFLQTS